MITRYLYEKDNQPIVIGLGFFDCIHLGHKALIEEVQRQAKKLNAMSSICTFQNDPNLKFNLPPQIYTVFERSMVLENLGLEFLILANFDDKFMNTDPIVFLNDLTNNFNIQGVVVGSDYTYGKNAGGNVDTLTEYFGKLGVKVTVVPFEKTNNEKLATRNLKKLLISGEIEELNACLSQPYFMYGTVIHAMHRGSKIGFPTANIEVNKNILKIAEGIYATKIYIDGVPYYGMTNVGIKPTFDEFTYSVETYILDFNEDIYGKEVKIEFFRKTRDIAKFDSVLGLQLQLKHDAKEIREYFGV